MSKKRERKTFVNKKTGHETSTSLPVEQNRLRAQGYVEQTPAPAAPVVQAPNPTGPAKK